MSYGTLFSPAWLENSVLELLRLWMPAYLGELERQQDRDEHLPGIASWGADSDLVRWPEQTPPAVMVASPGLIAPPVRDEDGIYRGTYGLEVGVLVASISKAPARRLAGDYGAAVIGALLQQSLGEPVDGVKWVGQAIDELPQNKSRSLAAVTNEFHVEIEDLVTDLDGPAEPPDDPYEPSPDDPEVDEGAVDVTLTRVAIS